VGQFSDAVETARKALALAEQQNKRDLAGSIKARIRLYQVGTPVRDTQGASAADSSRRWSEQ